MKRERVALAVDLKWRIDEAPAGATLRGLLKHSALALMQRPHQSVLHERNMEVIGKLAHGEHSNAA